MNTTPEITLYGATWCGGTRRVRLLLEENNIQYKWMDIDADETAARYVESVNHGNRSVPTLVWADGSMLVEPSSDELVEKLGI